MGQGREDENDTVGLSGISLIAGIQNGVIEKNSW